MCGAGMGLSLKFVAGVLDVTNRAAVPVPAVHVRIRFTEGWDTWATLGTDGALTEWPRATMQLPLSTDNQYARSVVLHEFGHVLGFRHEHQHPKRSIVFDT